MGTGGAGLTGFLLPVPLSTVFIGLGGVANACTATAGVGRSTLLPWDPALVLLLSSSLGLPRLSLKASSASCKIRIHSCRSYLCVQVQCVCVWGGRGFACLLCVCVGMCIGVVACVCVLCVDVVCAWVCVGVLCGCVVCGCVGVVVCVVCGWVWLCVLCVGGCGMCVNLLCVCWGENARGINVHVEHVLTCIAGEWT